MADRPFQRLRRFSSELQRRNVYRVAATYLPRRRARRLPGGQASHPLDHPSCLGDELFLAFLIVGFPVALVVAWAFEMTADGMRWTPEAEAAEEETATGSGGVQAGYKILLGLGLLAAAVAGGEVDAKV